MIGILVIGKMDYEKIVDISLTSRAFGAGNITICESDMKTIKKSTAYLNKIKSNWGGNFSINFITNWKEFIKSRKNTYKMIYLTRYGSDIKKTNTIQTYKNIMLIVSNSENIKELYNIADFNISITTQPHTIISSIAVFLNIYYRGRELAMHFENAKYKIIPSSHGIHVEKHEH